VRRRGRPTLREPRLVHHVTGHDPIKELLDELDPALFWQIHRSTVVNASAIASLSRDFLGHLIVKLKKRHETLPVSQPFAHRFRQM